MKMLAYGASTDYVDDYVRIEESIAIESLRRFVNAVVAVFGDQYLRSPNNDDITRLLAVGKQRGFPGMLGSIDCMYWRLKNCPIAWQGMYTRHIHEPMIILKAVASQNLWIWHASFRMPRSLNDINALDQSPLLGDLVEGRAPPVNYSINEHDYTMIYYLTDGIYPLWSMFVKTILCPQGNKKQHFAKAQKSARKDIERAFGVLQACFQIVRGPTHFWDEETLRDIMTTCIIMHNMIIKDEEDTSDSDLNYDAIGESILVLHVRTLELLDFVQTHHRIRDNQTNSQLQSDIIEHLWQQHRGE